jgi:aspartyl-tRNA synthetase
MNMKRCLIKNIVLNEHVRLSGFVSNIRDKKNICFLVLRDISGELQLTIDKNTHSELNDIISNLTLESVITVAGKVLANTSVKLNGMEMLVDDIKIESIAAANPIIDPDTSIDKRLDYRWIDLRDKKKTLMFQVQTVFVDACRQFLLNNRFVEIHTPKIISTESESGAGVFTVNYFDRKAFLAQSPQFYKQMAMAAGLERIFEVGPVFRAEKSNSRKHATEFSGLDIEVSYIDSYKDLMRFEEDMLIQAMTTVKEQYGDKIKQLWGVDIVIPNKPVPVIKLRELYEDLKDMYGYEVSLSEQGDMTTDAEKLCEKYAREKFNSEFLFVDGFNKNNRAFYHMREGDIACGYDLIWKGVEITTGAQREHRYDILKQQAEEKGLHNDVKDYLDFFRYGCPPHGGFGIGIDRITLLLFNTTIKEAMFLFRGPDRINP